MKTHLSPRVLVISASLLIVQFLTSAEAAVALDSWAMRYVAPFTLRSVTYGADPDIFVALGDAVYSSKDGMCWTKRPLDPPLYEGRGGLAYGNGTFVAVGEGSRVCLQGRHLLATQRERAGRPPACDIRWWQLPRRGSGISSAPSIRHGTG
jgi:hypothetical protein